VSNEASQQLDTTCQANFARHFGSHSSLCILLDVSRAAHLLGISVKTLRDWIQGRRIDYVKVGTRVMIRPETIRQFVTSNTRRAAG